MPVFLLSYCRRSHTRTDYIWGVVDIIPDTDFPDIRTRTSIHSLNGSCMIVPREGDMVRLYLQLMDADVVNPETGRVDRDKMGPEKLMKVASKTFHPYSIRAEEYHWWTLYISEHSRSEIWCLRYLRMVFSRTACGGAVLCP